MLALNTKRIFTDILFFVMNLDAIHESTLEHMEDYGLQIHGDESLEVYSAAGCDVDKKNNRVRFPRNLVNDSIESCPAEFTLCGRDPKNDTLIGGKNVAFKNFGTGVLIIDPDTRRG